jgi:hypothetical protein
MQKRCEQNKGIEYLNKNALWIIMDPWYPTPYEKDIKECSFIEEHNQKTLDKIIDYLPKVKYKCISCPKFITENNKTKEVFPHKKVNNFLNLNNNLDKLNLVMNKIQLNDIVYCGFHYGQCILHKPDGAINTSKNFSTWVKKDLCCLFPNKFSWEEADNITSKYSIII